MTPKERWNLTWRRAREGKRLPRPLDEKARTLLIERNFRKTLLGFAACVAAAPR